MVGCNVIRILPSLPHGLFSLTKCGVVAAFSYVRQACIPYVAVYPGKTCEWRRNRTEEVDRTPAWRYNVGQSILRLRRRRVGGQQQLQRAGVAENRRMRFH